MSGHKVPNVVHYIMSTTYHNALPPVNLYYSYYHAACSPSLLPLRLPTELSPLVATNTLICHGFCICRNFRHTRHTQILPLTSISRDNIFKTYFVLSATVTVNFNNTGHIFFLCLFTTLAIHHSFTLRLNVSISQIHLHPITDCLW